MSTLPTLTWPIRGSGCARCGTYTRSHTCLACGATETTGPANETGVLSQAENGTWTLTVTASHTAGYTRRLSDSAARRLARYGTGLQ